MPTNLIAYSFVEPGGELQECRFREVPPEILRFFDQHLDALELRARKGLSPPAKFQNAAARRRFEDLQQGSNEVFLAAAQELAKRLDEVTDHRMNRGFFVALRRSADQPTAAVLKLDVYDIPAAAVRRTAGGQAFFEAVQELLDLPGDLHKGAVFPDKRRSSDLVVVDRFESQYFLRALDVRQHLSGVRAVRQFMREVEEVAPERVEEVAEALRNQERPTTLRGFLKDNPSLLTEEQRSKILTDEKDQLRPVAKLSEGPRQAIVTADGIRVTGPALLVDQKVTWQPYQGRWRTCFVTAAQPKKTYR